MQTASIFPPAENVLQEIKRPLCSKDIKAGATYQRKAPNCTVCATVTFSEQTEEQMWHGSSGMSMHVSSNCGAILTLHRKSTRLQHYSSRENSH